MAEYNITLIAGGPAVHITLFENAVTQSPYNFAWNSDAVLQPVAVYPDATGFYFQAPVGMPPTQATASATATDIKNGSSGVLGINVIASQITFTSP
jgi:hypothetical protein